MTRYVFVPSFIGLIALSGCGTSTSEPDAPKPWLSAVSDERGPHGVGFRSQTLTREGEDGGTRTIALSVWYPAAPGTGEPLALSQYFDRMMAEDLLEETAELPRPQALVAAMTGDADALATDAAERALAMPVLAAGNAEPLTGPFPLALWSSRHATVFAQAPMSEVLASHGTIVATLWSSEPPLAFLWEDKPEDDKLATIAAHADDLHFGLEALRDHENVDPDRTVILSWSYGGQTAARVQEVDEGVLGVVGLDANVVPARPEERLNLRAPLVWMLGTNSSGRGLESASTLEAPNLVFALPELAHGNFNAMEGFLPGLLGTSTVYRWSSGGSDAVKNYRGLVRLVNLSVDALASTSGVDAGWNDLFERGSRSADEIGVTVELVHSNTSPPDARPRAPTHGAHRTWSVARQAKSISRIASSATRRRPVLHRRSIALVFHRSDKR